MINIGMFIDSIRNTWEKPDDFGMKTGSISFTMYIKGEYFNGKDIFDVRLQLFDKYYLKYNIDPDYFKGMTSSQPPDCVRYINSKIKQEVGELTEDKLSELSKVIFKKDDFDVWLETEKYNL
jgi:hypothetical protein